MYRVKFLKAGTESTGMDDWIVQGAQTTQFEPREGREYWFKDRITDIRAKRYIVTTVVIEQEWGAPDKAFARVYLKECA